MSERSFPFGCPTEEELTQVVTRVPYPRDSFFYVSFLAEEGDDFFMQWMCSKNIAHGGTKGFWYDGEMVKLFLPPKRKAELRQKKLKMH